MMQSSSQCTMTTPPVLGGRFMTPQIRPSSENRSPDAEPAENVVNILNDVTPPVMTSGSSSIDPLRDRPGDHQVQRVVDVRALRASSILLGDCLDRAVVAGLEREVDERRGAAERRRSRSGLGGLRPHRIGDGDVEMHVRVDAAGHHVHAGRVE